MGGEWWGLGTGVVNDVGDGLIVVVVDVVDDGLVVWIFIINADD